MNSEQETIAQPYFVCVRYESRHTYANYSTNEHTHQLMYKAATVHVKDAIVILQKSVPSDFYIMHVTWQTSLLEYCFFFTKTTTPRLTSPMQPPVQLVPGSSAPVDYEANYSPPSTANVQNAFSYTSTPMNIYIHWCLN